MYQKFYFNSIIFCCCKALLVTSSSSTASAEPKSSNENTSIVDNSLKIEETFNDSKQSSFNSLQLSGNIIGGDTQNLDHSLDISLNFQSPTIQSSSKDSQFVDIFNPGGTGNENVKVDSLNISDENSSEDMGCGLQFELSQDFSQVSF